MRIEARTVRRAAMQCGYEEYVLCTLIDDPGQEVYLYFAFGWLLLCCLNRLVPSVGRLVDIQPRRGPVRNRVWSGGGRLLSLYSEQYDNRGTVLQYSGC